jgi:hypothetical protein
MQGYNSTRGRVFTLTIKVEGSRPDTNSTFAPGSVTSGSRQEGLIDTYGVTWRLVVGYMIKGSYSGGKYSVCFPEEPRNLRPLKAPGR